MNLFSLVAGCSRTMELRLSQSRHLAGCEKGRAFEAQEKVTGIRCFFHLAGIHTQQNNMTMENHHF